MIISDNFSVDNTKELVENFDDRRIKYFRSDKSLPIADSWEFALSHAAGEFITFLSDDDVYLASRLEKVSELIKDFKTKLLIHKFCFYYSNGYENGKFKANTETLLIPYFSGQAVEVNSQETLTDMFSNFIHNVPALPDPVFFGNSPHMSDAVYHKSLFENLRKKLPKLMKSHRADYYLGVLVMNEIKNYVYLDEPLTVLNIHEGSTTVQVSKIKEQTTVAAANDNDLLYGNTPLTFVSEVNQYADILLEAAKDDPDLGDKYSINWQNFYRKHYLELTDVQKLGIDVSDYLKEFDEAIKNHLEEDADIASSKPKNKSGKIKSLARSLPVPQNIALSILAKFGRKQLIHGRNFALEGKCNEFGSISECAENLEREFIPVAKECWKKNRKIPKNWKLV